MKIKLFFKKKAGLFAICLFMMSSNVSFGQNLVLNGTCDVHTIDNNDNADAFDMTPPSELDGGANNSPYRALWNNYVLDTWLGTIANCSDNTEQPSSTSNGNKFGPDAGNGRGIALFEPCRRIYQTIEVTPGAQYLFSVDSRSEHSGTPTEVFMLNTEIDSETGLTSAASMVDAYMEITNDVNGSISSDINNTFKTNTLTFIASSNFVTIYLRSTNSVSSGTEVFYDNLSLEATGTATTPGTSGQVIGEFPIMDGGLEDQVDGTMSSAGSSQAGIPQTTWTVSSFSSASVSEMRNDVSLARTGNFSTAFQLNEGSSNLRLQSPSTTGSTNVLLTNTVYTIQFHYKTAVDFENDLRSGIYLNNNSGGVISNTTDDSPFVADSWIKTQGTITTGADFNDSHWAVARITNNTLFQLDDFVVYAGSFDDTAPNDPTTGTYANNAGVVTIGWSAPSGGVDGGGYVVVNYASEPNDDNDPNQNGIYEFGNTTTNGTDGLTGTIAYIGTDLSFTDAYTAGNFYKIYAVDKAFNYSNEIEVTENPTKTTWLGTTDTNWATNSNWDFGEPISSLDVFIPSGLSNYPVVSETTGAVVNNLTVDAGASLSIENGGSIIVNGSSTGNISYNRTVTYAADNSSGWYLVASPTVGETYDDTWIATNDIASGTGSNRGIGTYNTQTDDWSYYQAGTDSSPFTSGIGYSIKRGTTSGSITFTGSINTADVPAAVISASNGYNLIGNPYPAYINSSSFLTNMTDLLASETIWLWNPDTNNYDAKVTNEDFIVSPGQGFFARANSNTVLNFSHANQLNSADTFKESTKTEIKIQISDGINNRFAKIYYVNNATTSFDNGYDGEAFGGISNTFDIYTHLLSNNEGKKYQIQSLPNSDFETLLVPIGVHTESGKEITFTSEVSNLPEGMKVFLEDRQENTFTRLDKPNTNYKIIQTTSANEVGRFYLHTSQNTLNIFKAFLDNTSIYRLNNSSLRIVGLWQEKVSVKLFNILGKQLLNTFFEGNGVNDITLPKNLNNGVYIVRLETVTGTLNKKIILE
jgi:hypothetical protein